MGAPGRSSPRPTETRSTEMHWRVWRAPLQRTAGRPARSTITRGWAVGANDGHEVRVEHYDGRSWQIVDAPNPVRSSRDSDRWLAAITCVSSVECWAVGGTSVPNAAF